MSTQKFTFTDGSTLEFNEFVVDRLQYVWIYFPSKNGGNNNGVKIYVTKADRDTISRHDNKLFKTVGVVSKRTALGIPKGAYIPISMKGWEIKPLLENLAGDIIMNKEIEAEAKLEKETKVKKK